MGLQGVLAMWDKRLFEKLEDCVGKLTGAYKSKNVEDIFCGPFASVNGPNLDNT